MTFPVGLIWNKAHQWPRSVFHADETAAYTLAIVEFDDQGLCYHRAQMDALEHELASLRGQGAVILAFVHGWRHDARTEDDNLREFRGILATLATEAAAHDRPVLGVFVGWRGMSWHGLCLDYLTFWGRKAAALRVALGSTRELLARLKTFDPSGKDSRRPKLVIIGHSFGGLIVYSAVAQSLIEAASTQCGQIIPSFADLVLLVNPAFEAVRYMPIHEQVELRSKSGSFVDQPPVFVSVTARNDWATHYAFRIGSTLGTLGESTLGRRERQALVNTMGHLDWMRTHRLWAENGQPTCRRERFHPCNPFWVVQATPEMVNGHNGIFSTPFRAFAHQLVTHHLPQPAPTVSA